MPRAPDPASPRCSKGVPAPLFRECQGWAVTDPGSGHGPRGGLLVSVWGWGHLSWPPSLTRPRWAPGRLRSPLFQISPQPGGCPVQLRVTRSAVGFEALRGGRPVTARDHQATPIRRPQGSPSSIGHVLPNRWPLLLQTPGPWWVGPRHSARVGPEAGGAAFTGPSSCPPPGKDPRLVLVSQ